MAKTLGSAAQFHRAVQGQRGNAIGAVGAAAAVVGGIVHYAMGRVARASVPTG